MGQISEKAIGIAESYCGKAEEKPNDAVWLEDLMNISGNPTGWNPGESYCIAALVAIFTIALKGAKWPFVVSKSTQAFYQFAKQAGWCSKAPGRGDIVIFEIGDTGKGHAELVTSVEAGGIRTIGFNTSATSGGSQHNGEGCYAKLRKFSDFPQTAHPKLWIRGYVTTSRL